ncbi:MAG: GABA permease, partial [Pseudomonas sp.]
AFRAWLFPYANIVALCALLAVIGTQAFEPASRFQFWFTVLTVVLVVAGYFLTRQRTTAAAQEAEAKMGETRNGVPGRN